MTIRPAQATDIEAIINLLRQVNRIHHQGRPDLFSLGTKYTDRELVDLIADPSRPVLVAEDKGAIKGYAFCVLQRHRNDNILTDIDTLYLDDLCVDQASRGIGIGKQLYQAVLELAKSHNCHNVTLNVWSFNQNAMKFYEACGMHPLKICMETVLD